MTYVIAEPCIDITGRSCVEECPVDCIYEGIRMLYIQPDECIDCGACEPVCPVDAIFFENDLPAEWSAYAEINVDFFAELGSPGGRSSVGCRGTGPPRRGGDAPAGGVGAGGEGTLRSER